MFLISEAPKFTKWFCVSIGTSLLLLVLIGYCFRKPIYYTSSLYSSLISSIATAVPFIITVFYNNSDVAYNSLFLIYGYQLISDSITILYIFQCILKKKQGFGKTLVYVGYMWILFTTSIFFTLAITSKNNNWKSDYGEIYSVHNLVSITILLIFGFILILLFLFFIVNRRMSAQVFNYVITYIVLVAIAFLGITILMSVRIQNFEVFDAISFIFVDLPVKIVIVITAYYGDIWVNKSYDTYSNYETRFDILESNR